ncbi:AAA domain-containing protein [Isoptericola sp. b408]|uniref:AAA domain-containing protein n=1 Tax=Isoptericola sp. b408 TaxID=3064653 RepID=UPI0027132861|nr:AAA domain-containing protein [Isoptericola sp. b408]MDO8151243.1 AAA domain-containing protein [Isoptericola sp. b408]
MFSILELTREEIITGRSDELRVDEKLETLLGAAGRDEVVYYGWPTLVLRDPKGNLRVAPLLMTELEPPAADEQTAVPRDDAPYLNPGVLNESFFPADALAASEAPLAGGLAFDDIDALGSQLSDLCEHLGIAADSLDPDRLTSASPMVGLHNAAMVFRGVSNLATRALAAELSELLGRDDWSATAARWLVDPPRSRAVDRPPVADEPQGEGPVQGLPPLGVEGLNLNDSQEQAVAAAVADDLTVVTGPPGTGKSQLVASTVVNQWVAGRTVLVASTNNAAVDVAVRRTAAIDEALLMRTGNRKYRDQLPALLEQIASRNADGGASQSVVQRHLQAVGRERHDLLEELSERTRVESALAQALVDAESLRMLVWGVRGPAPVHEHRAALHLLAVKASGTKWRWLSERRLRRVLSLAQPTGTGVIADDVAAWARHEHDVDELTEKLEQLGPTDPERDRERLATIAGKWARTGTATLRNAVQHRIVGGGGGPAIQNLARVRPAYASARNAAVQRALPYVSGWACTTLSAKLNFPLVAGLFDLLVIDEASQCSIADVLPLAYRAKRILVVGDPNQLTPIVTLARTSLDQIASAVGKTDDAMHHLAVSAGRDSAFTAYAARYDTEPHLLAEHYRCHPEIARFFNEQFYGGALRVLTDVTSTRGRHAGISLVDVPGKTQRGPTGGAFNDDEADAVVRWVQKHKDDPGTVGVVTPFAVQADLLRRKLRRAIGDDVWASKDITVGTAHRFQGDERDVILFSTVLASGVHVRTASWVESTRNLVNVAVSRAKRALVIFGDSAEVRNVPVPTLHLLFDAASGASGPAVRDELTDVAMLHSEAEKRLFEALSRRGFVPRAKVIVEGYELDFVIDAAGGRLNVEVDGTHHRDARGRQRRQDLSRDRVLERLGMTVLRVPAWRCLAEPQGVTDDVLAVVARL